MAELKIYLSKSLNEKFRRIAMSVHGYGRGSLSKAAEEAFTKWCSEHEPSPIPDKIVGYSPTTEDQSSLAAESHNPDERENRDHEARRFGEDKSLDATGSST
jgi:hypothetical protein